MNQRELLGKIEQAAREKATSLDLSYNQLSSLPPAIAQLQNLQGLDLSYNQLSSLPPAIAQLQNLQGLYLSYNQLSSLPPAIAQLQNLQGLYLSYNQLSSLPPAIAQLQNLQGLYLSYNQLSSLPPAIGQLQNLQRLDLSYNQLSSLPPAIGQLQNLQRLDLSYNQLSSLPPAIGQLQNLQRLDLSFNQLSSLPPAIAQLQNLQELNLSGNQLSSLPPAIGQLQNLQELNLSHNQLSSLPPAIAQLQNLQELNLSHNQLSSLPPAIAQLQNLQELNLRGNQLSSLPSAIAQLQNLQGLYFHDNPLLIPPEILGPTWAEVVRNEATPAQPQTIIRYYLQKEKHPLNEAKMLLLGQGSVRKTSLVNQILTGKYNPQENKTHGINIQQWKVKRVGEGKEEEGAVQVNIWDFGGQEIMHSTHQFFLTERSLYLVVLDCRQGEEENRLEYWLKLVDSFGGKSPVLIIGNKVDQHSLDLDQRGLQRKYPRIKGFVETSCAQGTGIDNLKKRITEEINQLKHVGDLLPQSWFKVKTQLEALQQDYIPYDQYMTLCQEQQVEDQDSQRVLVRFLHDLGVVVNFQEDQRLQDTNVLKPEWVTNGVYKILNYRDLIIEHKGILKLSLLEKILSNRYPRHKHPFLVKLMEKFELCFPLRDRTEQYLIPDLLPKEEVDTGNWDNALTFEYHYRVLPSSIFSRFMVRVHEQISQKTYWRTGVVLQYEECRALVRSDREDKIITIDITGAKNRRRGFLSSLRLQFNTIHNSFKGLEVTQKVRLPDHPNILIPYQHLLSAEEAGEKTYFVPELGKKVDLKPLLDGFEAEGDRSQQQIRRDSYRQSSQTQEPLQNQPESPKPSIISFLEKTKTGYIFLLVSTIFIILLFNPDFVSKMNDLSQGMVKVITAIFAAMTVYSFSGELKLEAKIPQLNQTKIRATGALAAFVLVLLLLFVDIPTGE